MIFNEDVVLRSPLFEGNKLAASSGSSSTTRGRSIVQCRFGPLQSPSLVSISQTLDKLVVYDLSSLIETTHLFAQSSSSSSNNLQRKNYSNDADDINDLDQVEQANVGANSIQFISIKNQVICSLEVVPASGQHRNSSSTSNNNNNDDADEREDDDDLLLIGCTNSILIYATRTQAHLSSVDTSANLKTILAVSLSLQPELDANDRLNSSRILVCAGVQKLYTYALTSGFLRLGTSSSSGLSPSFELSSERTTSETISCLAFGNHNGLACLATGSREHQIKLYTIDAFDQNIQACRLTLNESAPISYLCAIETCAQEQEEEEDDLNQAFLNIYRKKEEEEFKAREAARRGLPPLGNRCSVAKPKQNRDKKNQAPQMKYLAYGLENGAIGVYHLRAIELNSSSLFPAEQDAGAPPPPPSQMFGEPLWRHKSKQIPVSLLMFDLNGDGLDELIVGYRNGRLEVRSPFTGQLLGAMRLFKSASSSGNHQLAGLVKWPIDNQIGELSPRPALERSKSSGSDDRNEKGINLTRMQQPERSGSALIACSSSSELVVFRPRQKRAHELLRDHLADYFCSPPKEPLRGGNNSSSDHQLSKFDQVQALAAAAAGAAEPLQLGIETRGDDTRAVASDARQSAELMRRVGALSNERRQLELRLTRLYQDLVKRQVAKRKQLKQTADLLHGTDSAGGGLLDALRLSHSWSFDSARKQLRLSLLIKNTMALPHQPGKTKQAPEFIVDMIECCDESDDLLESDKDKQLQYHQHVFIYENQSSAQSSKGGPHLTLDLWLNSSEYNSSILRRGMTCGGPQRQSNDWRNLRLRVFCKAAQANHQQQQQQSTRAQKVHEQLIVLPPFAMLVPEPLVAIAAADETDSAQQQLEQQQGNDQMISLTFALHEGAQYLQVLDWMQTNFLLKPLSSTFSPDQQSEEFRFVDLRREAPAAGAREAAAETTTIRRYHLRILIALSLASSMREAYELTLESDDPDLLVELIRSLVLDRLQLSMQSHLLVPEDSSRGPKPRSFGPLTQKLDALLGSSRQLEESENRIQTEIYESAELIKSLMQQFAISNQLNEFVTSRELLGEISMMLNRTQDSAQAYQLNSRSRQELTQEANRLREKMAFLSGASGDGAWPSFSSASSCVSFTRQTSQYK